MDSPGVMLSSSRPQTAPSSTKLFSGDGMLGEKSVQPVKTESLLTGEYLQPTKFPVVKTHTCYGRR